MSEQLPTTYRSSSGEIAIADMAFSHLRNALAKLQRQGDGATPVAIALESELSRRGPATHQLEPGPASQEIGANKPPPPEDERAAFKLRLEESVGAKKIIDELVKLELRASRLPEAEKISTDEDVQTIDAWVIDAARLNKELDAFHEDMKAPYLMRGRVIDEFKREIGGSISVRVSAIQARKRAYLIAKAERERQAREAEALALRQQQEAQEAIAQAERDRAREIEEKAAAAKQRLADAEAARAVAPEDPDAQGKADDAEQSYRLAVSELVGHQDAATIAEHQAGVAGDLARDAEAGAAEPTHRLAKAGESGLKSVWKHRVTSARAFSASLGPIEPYFREAQITEALERAAKADPRPTIPGVEFYEDFEVTTNTRAKR